MADEYIKRQPLLDAYDAAHKGPPGGARKLIQEAPAEDVVPVVHGRWENIRFLTTGDGRVRVGDCSSCKSIERVRNYCPNCNCGARMDGEGYA